MDQPTFNGGGWWGTMTLDACQQQCLATKGCVAVEWNAHTPAGTAQCRGAWACSDLSNGWGNGRVYRLETVNGVWQGGQRQGPGTSDQTFS